MVSRPAMTGRMAANIGRRARCVRTYHGPALSLRVSLCNRHRRPTALGACGAGAWWRVASVGSRPGAVRACMETCVLVSSDVLVRSM
ncbi:hypothetical protein BDA96_01G475200 [Sorghum bicolor]|uniref:Uncharacterized protein n=1 Tax=Sorghum bicolor TaxID=4558 RepID=A0A921S5V5_SORBI|nr:hypothetical protein BDA96_01G475200 [Sorghum bicolor]